MKKTFRIIKTIAVWFVVAVAVFMMIFTVVSVNTFNRNDRNFFGYRLYIVNSDSMAATDFSSGDLIFVKETDPSTLQEGDIITYISQDSEIFGEINTHKIRKRTVDAEGNPGFVTYGTMTNVDDATIVTYPFILGKYTIHLAGVGNFFYFLKTPQGYFICIFVPFMLLIIYQAFNYVRLFRRYKREQIEEMEAEKAKIAAEREQNAKMLADLQALKAWIDAREAVPKEPPKTDDSAPNAADKNSKSD